MPTLSLRQDDPSGPGSAKRLGEGGSRTTTPLPSLPGSQVDPAWAPDGETLAFVWETSSGSAIATMRLDGSDVTKIADGDAPTWSPDGRWLAYTAYDALYGAQIWVALTDGSSAQPLTAMPGFVGDTAVFATTHDASWGQAT